MKSTPLQTVKARFGEKTKLVDAVKEFVNDDLWVSRVNKDKGLERVSNAKLLRLLDTFSAVQSKWGTRAKLIDAVAELEGHGKDAGRRTTLETWPVPRLYDQYKSLARRAAQAEKKGNPAAPRPTPAKPAPEAAVESPKSKGGVIAAAGKAIRGVETQLGNTVKRAAAAVDSALGKPNRPKKTGKKEK